MTKQLNLSIPLPTRKMTYLPVGLILGAALAFGINSMAENTELDSGPRVFPYNGVLELDGTGFTGQADFQFTLTDDESCSYIESHDAVTVSGGRFSVNIGGVDSNANPLPVCVFDSEQMFIQIAVREGGDNQPHRTLTGRQRIHPVPFAYWAAEGSDFRVDGDINMSGNLNTNGGSANLAGGNLNGVRTINRNGNNPIVLAGGVDVTGDLTVGEINGLAEINPGAGPFSAPGVFSLTNTQDASLTNDGALVIGNKGGDNITIDGNEIVARNNGSADTLAIQFDGGATSVGGNLTVNGSTTTLNTGLVLTGPLSDPNSNVTIEDGLNITGDLQDSNSAAVTINDDLKVTGTLLRPVYRAQPNDNGSGFNNVYNVSRNICTLIAMDTFNENNDHCRLTVDGSGNYDYSGRDANCTVQCWTWN